MATIKDVAALAGVSVSTVSYAMSGTRPISAEKKALIREAMKKLHYRPHAIAQSLASKRTHIVAILFPQVEHGIGLSEIELIMQAAESTIAQGYHLVIWTLQTDGEDELMQLIRQNLVDGIILMEVHSQDTRIPTLKKSGIPFILLGRDQEEPSESFIDVDFFATMMQCLSYLKTLGHRHIVFINQSEVSFQNGYGPQVRTHEAFLSICKDFDMTGTEYFWGNDTLQICGMMETALQEHPLVSAFIAMNDKALPGIIKGIDNRGLKIGADISVVSIVSSATAVSLVLPPVTAFEMDGKRLMELAVTQLIAKIEGRYAELPQRLIPCILRERFSTGKAEGRQDPVINR